MNPKTKKATEKKETKKPRTLSLVVKDSSGKTLAKEGKAQTVIMLVRDNKACDVHGKKHDPRCGWTGGWIGLEFKDIDAALLVLTNLIGEISSKKKEVEMMSQVEKTLFGSKNKKKK